MEENLNEILDDHNSSTPELRETEEKVQEDSEEKASEEGPEAIEPLVREQSKDVNEIIDDLKAQLEELKNEINSIKSAGRIPTNQIIPNQDLLEDSTHTDSNNNEEMYPVTGITAKTEKESQEWMEKKLEDAKANLDQSIVQGASIMQHSQEFLQGLPLTKDWGATVAIIITNYMNLSLTAPKFDFARGKICGVAPEVIVGLTREVLYFQGDTVCSSGLCSYRIGSSSLRFTIKFAAGHNGHILLGLGFTPFEVPMNGKLYNFNRHKPARPDLKFMYDDQLSNAPQKCTLQHGSFLGRATMTPGPKSVLKVEIAEASFRTVNEKEHSTPEVRAVTSGNSFMSVSHEDLTSVLVDKMGCVVEITNMLDVPLKGAQRYIYHCNHHDFLPIEIPSFAREMFFASDDRYVEGVFAYDIDSTDLKIAVVFLVTREKRWFGVSFLEKKDCKPEVNKELLYLLSDENEWRTRPDRKFVDAKDNPKKYAELRNLRLEAQMLNESRSVLRVCVQAL